MLISDSRAKLFKMKLNLSPSACCHPRALHGILLLSSPEKCTQKHGPFPSRDLCPCPLRPRQRHQRTAPVSRLPCNADDNGTSRDPPKGATFFSTRHHSRRRTLIISTDTGSSSLCAISNLARPQLPRIKDEGSCRKKELPKHLDSLAFVLPRLESSSLVPADRECLRPVNQRLSSHLAGCHNGEFSLDLCC